MVLTERMSEWERSARCISDAAAGQVRDIIRLHAAVSSQIVFPALQKVYNFRPLHRAPTFPTLCVRFDYDFLTQLDERDEVQLSHSDSVRSPASCHAYWHSI